MRLERVRATEDAAPIQGLPSGSEPTGEGKVTEWQPASWQALKGGGGAEPQGGFFTRQEGQRHPKGNGEGLLAIRDSPR